MFSLHSALLNLDTKYYNSEVRIKNTKLHNMDHLTEESLYFLGLVCRNTMQNKQQNTTLNLIVLNANRVQSYCNIFRYYCENLLFHELHYKYKFTFSHNDPDLK